MNDWVSKKELKEWIDKELEWVMNAPSDGRMWKGYVYALRTIKNVFCKTETENFQVFEEKRGKR